MARTGILRPSTKTEYAVPDGTPFWVTEILNGFSSEEDGPHTYLAEQVPNYALRPHFHNASQFQIIVRGTGHFARHAIEPVVVHYTERQNGYGPIVSGETGLAYMVLRAIKDIPKSFFLPESVKLIEPGGTRRQKTSAIHRPSTEAELLARSESSTETMIAPDASGLASWLVRAAPGTKVEAPRGSEGQGQYYVVITGSAEVNGETLPPQSATWVAPGEIIEMQAGPKGADIAILQFPRNSWPVSAPADA